MRKISQDEVREILNKHNKWLKNEFGGIRAELNGVDLSKLNFYGANLIKANLNNSILTLSDFTSANLTEACLKNADLTGALFQNACLRNADLTNAELIFAIFINTDLTGTILNGAKNIPTWLDDEEFDL